MATRNYKEEYRKFQSSTKQKKKRALRNKKRREAIRKGIVRKGDGKDMSEVKGKDGKVRWFPKPSKDNKGENGKNSNMPGDKKARGKGQKKNQPKRKKRKS